MNKERARRLARRIRREDSMCQTELRYIGDEGMFTSWAVDCYRAGVGFRVRDEEQWKERHANIVFEAAHAR